MNVLAVLSAKGGVGKTTAAVNLAASSALNGRRTLLIDLDPQGASGHLLRIRAEEHLKARKFWNGEGDLEPLIRAADLPGLDVLPALDSLRRADAALEDLDHSKRRLEGLLDRLEGWDQVVLDCPPGLGLLTQNVLRAADLILVPVTPSPLALRTLEPLAALAKRQRDRIRPFLSMVRQENETSEQLREEWPQTLATVIPLAPAVELAALERIPVVVQFPRSRIALAYRTLLAEALGQVPPELGAAP